MQWVSYAVREGAGPLPTASAVWSDVLEMAKVIQNQIEETNTIKVKTDLSLGISVPDQMPTTSAFR